MWMVRAAAGGRLADEFKEQCVVAIGWDDVGDLSRYSDKSEVLEVVKKEWPDWSDGKVQSAASQLIRFRDQIKEGDRVITYDSSRRMYLVGTITGPYKHQPGVLSPFENTHAVKWEGEVERDILTSSTRNRLGSTLTLFLVPDFAAEEIEAALKGGLVAPREEPEESSEEALIEDVKDQSREYIKDKISRLDPYQFQDLVAGLLRAMDYKTRVSPPGADRGIDIIASPDGFGFEPPRIVVECKHRRGTSMGSQEIRSFLGGRHKDDKGLYVSTGGFTKDARYEAERANIPVTLMDLDDLVKAVIEQYENMDTETRLLLPLVKVYWPA